MRTSSSPRDYIDADFTVYDLDNERSTRRKQVQHAPPEMPRSLRGLLTAFHTMLLVCAVLLCVALALLLWQDGNDAVNRWNLGPVPTSYVGVDVGHGGMSQFSVSNIGGTIRVIEFLPGNVQTVKVYAIASGMDSHVTARLQFDAQGNMQVMVYPQAHILFWRLPTTTPDIYRFTNNTTTDTYTPEVP